MKIKSFIESVGNFKVKDSVKERLKKTLISCGIPIKGDVDNNMFYIHAGIATPIENEEVFIALGVPEYDIDKFYEDVTEAIRNAVEYNKGQVLVATTSAGTKLAFVYVEELKGGELLGIGESERIDGSRVILNRFVRYTKSRCRKANAAEISAFVKNFEESTGISLKREGSIINLFPLRQCNQEYFYLEINWKTGKISVKKTNDQGTVFDDEKFSQGNYFETEQEAINTASSFKFQ